MGYSIGNNSMNPLYSGHSNIYVLTPKANPDTVIIHTYPATRGYGYGYKYKGHKHHHNFDNRRAYEYDGNGRSGGYTRSGTYIGKVW